MVPPLKKTASTSLSPPHLLIGRKPTLIKGKEVFCMETYLVTTTETLICPDFPTGTANPGLKIGIN